MEVLTRAADVAGEEREPGPRAFEPEIEFRKGLADDGAGCLEEVLARPVGFTEKQARLGA